MERLQAGRGQSAGNVLSPAPADIRVHVRVMTAAVWGIAAAEAVLQWRAPAPDVRAGLWCHGDGVRVRRASAWQGGQAAGRCQASEPCFERQSRPRARDAAAPEGTRQHRAALGHIRCIRCII